MAWGSDSEGQCDVPPGLTNVVAVVGGGAHSLALEADGSLTAWGADWSEPVRHPVLGYAPWWEWAREALTPRCSWKATCRCPSC